LACPEPERETNLLAKGIEVQGEPMLQVKYKRSNCRILGIQQQYFLSCNDSFDVLKVYNDGMFSPQYS
jgi:hypothetical protein